MPYLCFIKSRGRPHHTTQKMTTTEILSEEIANAATGRYCYIHPSNSRADILAALKVAGADKKTRKAVWASRKQRMQEFGYAI